MPKTRIAQYGTKHGHAAGKLLALRRNPRVELAGVFEPDLARRRELSMSAGRTMACAGLTTRASCLRIQRSSRSPRKAATTKASTRPSRSLQPASMSGTTSRREQIGFNGSV